MMQTLYGGMVIAAAVGVLAGGAVRVDPYQLGDRPRGPQQIFSMPTEWGSQEVLGYASIEYPSGPFADHVIGTDWLPGGRHDRPYGGAAWNYTADAFEIEDIETMKARLYAKYDIPLFPDPPAPPPAEAYLDAEPLPDRAAEVPQIVLADYQGRGQVYDLAHGSDPGAEVSEPEA
jgi:hypothetical protein